MAFRGGGGRFGGARSYRRAKEEPFVIFPEIEGLESATYDSADIKKEYRFVTMSESLQSFFQTSPYYYEDRSKILDKIQKVDIERYSDRKAKKEMVKPPLWHFIKMDMDHMPAELARGGEKRIAKKVRWDNQSELDRLDVFEKLEKKSEGQEGAEKKEDEEEDEEDLAEAEEDGEFSDDGDYEGGRDFDDDEDDYNKEEENDEAEY